MNLPNAITAARIAVAPAIVWLIVLPSWPIRLAAWILYLAAAITDYYDGKLARSRNLVTDLGRLLDPLADKLLLVCTLSPMWWLMRGVPLVAPMPAAEEWVANGVIGPVIAGPHISWPLVTPFGLVGLPLWVVLVVLGREAAMTVFRQYAARRDHLRNRSREMEDGIPVHVGRRDVLLVLRGRGGRALRLDVGCVALLRDVHRHRGHRHHGRRRRVDALLARVVCAPVRVSPERLCRRSATLASARIRSVQPRS